MSSMREVRQSKVNEIRLIALKAFANYVSKQANDSHKHAHTHIRIYIHIYIYVAAQLPIQPILRWAKPNFRSEVGLDFAGPF